MKRKLACIFAFLCILGVLAENKADSTKIYFKIGHRQFYPELGDNRASMDRFVNSVRQARDADDIDHIVVRAYASPDGQYDANKRLTGYRCDEISRYIIEATGINPDLIHSEPEGVAWDKLRSLVATTPDVPSRDKVLDILDNTPVWVLDRTGRVVDGRKKQLMQLDGGTTYHWMFDNLFPSLRNAVAMSLYLKSELRADNHGETVTVTTETETTADNNVNDNEPPVLVADTITTDTVSVSSAAKADSIPLFRDKGRKLYMSLSTNMLYDALLLPNIGIEYYIGKNWSVNANWLYGWWDRSKRHRYWRAYGGDISVRKWLGSAAARKPLSGHHIGIYAQMLLYDFEFGNKGQMGGMPGGKIWEQANYGAGVEYGLSLPVHRHINIDFSLGIGYIGGKYYEYRPEDGHYIWLGTKKRRLFGPTKAQISFVWLIGHDNINTKGGVQ